MKQTLQFDGPEKPKTKLSRSHDLVSFHFISFRFVSLIEERKKERKKERKSVEEPEIPFREFMQRCVPINCIIPMLRLC